MFREILKMLFRSHPSGDYITPGWGGLGLHGERGGIQAHGGQVQWPLQGVGAGQQGVETPGGGEGGHCQ